MFDKLRQLDQHYSVLQAKLNAPETYNDPKLVAELNRELRELEEVVTAYRSWEQWDQSCRESETLLDVYKRQVKSRWVIWWTGRCPP